MPGFRPAQTATAARSGLTPRTVRLTCPRRLVQVECRCIAGISAKLGGRRSEAEPGGQLGKTTVSGPAAGIPFHFHGPGADSNLLPSVDRVDSDGHYETSNVQIVCRFVNFLKSDTDDEEFRRLLILVRGADETE